MTEIKFRKIEVEGNINLGERRELIQGEHITKKKKDSSFFKAAVRGDSATMDSAANYDDNEFGRQLEFTLSEESVGSLDISGSGLVTSFGVFGAPGCGKTVLLMHMMEQILSHSQDDPDKRYGALILDPKAALMEDIIAMVKLVGREKDLVIINTDYLDDLNHDSQFIPPVPVNIIDCCIDPYELGAILVLAGRSSGVDASDPFWFQEWTNLFASSLNILKLDAELNLTSIAGPIPITLKKLLDSIFEEQDGYRKIVKIARDLSQRSHELDSDELRRDLSIDLNMIERFFKQDYVGTIEAFIIKAFGMFRRSKLSCYSDPARNPMGTPFYEDIIENGRIVLVSVAPSEPALAKTLTTLIKVLFQRTVLARGELLSQGIITNNVRPLLMACDEYSEVASEVQGQSMGDGQFLALARQYGCMAILATQSVNVLEASSLKETWRSVFSNFAAKIYMRLADNETAEEATKLAGESDWKLVSSSSNISKDGMNTGRQDELRERKNLPTTIMTQGLKRGEAVVIGTLDGGASRPGTFFLKVPYKNYKIIARQLES